jgi:hypothetical protein
MDTDFWGKLVQGLGLEELDWLQIQVQRRKVKLQNRTIARKAIIRK